MFDHLGLAVSQLAESKSFYLKALAPLGVSVVKEVPHAVGLGRDGKPSFWLADSQVVKPTPLHIAFAADNRAQVDAFYRAALEAGGRDNGAPGLRPHYHPHYYGAFVYGPDGHNIEVVCHRPE